MYLDFEENPLTGRVFPVSSNFAIGLVIIVPSKFDLWLPRLCFAIDHAEIDRDYSSWRALHVPRF